VIGVGWRVQCMGAPGYEYASDNNGSNAGQVKLEIATCQPNAPTPLIAPAPALRNCVGVGSGMSDAGFTVPAMRRVRVNGDVGTGIGGIWGGILNMRVLVETWRDIRRSKVMVWCQYALVISNPHPGVESPELDTELGRLSREGTCAEAGSRCVRAGHGRRGGRSRGRGAGTCWSCLPLQSARLWESLLMIAGQLLAIFTRTRRVPHVIGIRANAVSFHLIHIKPQLRGENSKTTSDG